MSPLHSIKHFRWLCVALTLGAFAACSSEPRAADPSREAAPARQATAATPAPQSTAAAPSAPQPVDLPPRAVADFERAVALLRAGKTTEAELEFKQLAAGFPQFAGPYVNIGLLCRNTGRLDQAEEAFNAAVERNPASAVAWNELGVTLRMRGKFQDARTAYERAIAADENFAPAHRNLAVLLDLYLGDPLTALDELERYQEIVGEDKTVNGWIAEIKQRAGR